MANNFKDRDDLLDQLFDHIFGESEVDDDDHAWFEAKVASFFDTVVDGNKPPGRRRQKQAPAPPKRRRPGAPENEGGGSGEKGDKSGGGGYGAGWLFGGS